MKQIKHGYLPFSYESWEQDGPLLIYNDVTFTDGFGKFKKDHFTEVLYVAYEAGLLIDYAANTQKFTAIAKE